MVIVLVFSNTPINLHLVLQYGFVGTCPGIEPVTGRSQVQSQDKYQHGKFFSIFFFPQNLFSLKKSQPEMY